MSNGSTANALKYLEKYPLWMSYSPEEALSEFNGLNSQERYEVLKELWKDPWASREFLKAILPEPEWRYCVSPLDRMKTLIEETRDGLKSLSPRSPDALWEGRFEVAKMLYQLEAWQLDLQWAHVENPGDSRFDETHRFLLGALKVFYRKTQPPGDRGNPLFDTDGDGVGDDRDAFPLDPYFADDKDNDRMPDELDPFPNNKRQWHDLRSGERRELRLPNGGTLIRAVSDEEGNILLEVPVEFSFSDKDVEKEFRFRWPETQKKMQGLIEGHAPAGIKFRLIEEEGAENKIIVSGKNGRDESTHWSLPLLGDVSRLVHELQHSLMRWMGRRDDRYQEDYAYPRDHVFEPGREVLVDEKDVMRDDWTGSKILPEDLLIPLGFVAKGPSAPGALSSFMGGASQDKAAANGRLGDLAVDREAKRKYYEAVLTAAKEATELNPKDAYNWLALAVANGRLGDLAVDREVKQRHYEADLTAALKATELNPKGADNWLALAAANRRLGDLAVDRDEKRRYYETELAAALKATELNPKDDDNWQALAAANERLGDLAMDREVKQRHYEADLTAALKATDLNPKDDDNWLALAVANGRLGDLASSEDVRRFYKDEKQRALRKRDLLK